jgi:hypothetical protein
MVISHPSGCAKLRSPALLRLQPSGLLTPVPGIEVDSPHEEDLCPLTVSTLKFMLMISKNSVPASQKTYCVSIIRRNILSCVGKCRPLREEHRLRVFVKQGADENIWTEER